MLRAASIRRADPGKEATFMSTGPLRPTTLEIDLDAAAENLRAVRGLVGPSR
jgi:hypothetical protein